jgi:hypothetical protein
MQYLLFVCTAEDAPAYDPADDDIDDWGAEIDRRGVGRGGNRLRPPADATTVRVREGRLQVTDGPFAETKEWIAGFDVLECADLDEAIELAGKHPMARYGQIEIRPVWPLGAE